MPIIRLLATPPIMTTSRMFWAWLAPRLDHRTANDNRATSRATEGH